MNGTLSPIKSVIWLSGQNEDGGVPSAVLLDENSDALLDENEDFLFDEDG